MRRAPCGYTVPMYADGLCLTDAVADTEFRLKSFGFIVTFEAAERRTDRVGFYPFASASSSNSSPSDRKSSRNFLYCT